MVVIRNARSSETGRLAEIGFAAWERAVAGWGEDVAALSANARQAYGTFTRESWNVILVGEIDSMVAGWGGREVQRNIISDLWVEPRFQGRGVGSALLEALEHEIAVAGFETAEIETHARNSRAIELYKRKGYLVRALSIKYVPSLDRDIEKIELAKALDR